MGFEFGLINSLDPDKSVYAFLGVVAFIIFFDYLSGVLEYFVEKSTLYHKMVKIIYKELMLMGLVALTITMYEADSEESEENEESIEVIDFVHIVLFYVTIFFVLHAIYLMIMSIRSDTVYRQQFAQSTSDLVNESDSLYKNPTYLYLFRMQFNPFSSLRDKIEFSIIHSIFGSTYALPKGFHFPAYLSGCYARFALKAINRSLFTWVILLVIVLCNYFRILSGYNCHIHKEIVEEHVERRRLDFSNNNSDHECRVNTINYFFFIGSVMVVYNTIVYLFSRLYKIRLLQHAGTNTPEDYVNFMKYKLQYERKQQDKDYAHSFHWTNETLKKEIEEEMDANESPDEEEEEFRSIALGVQYVYRRIYDLIATIRIEIRLFIVRMFCPSRLENLTNKQGSLLKNIKDKPTNDKGPAISRESELTSTAIDTGRPAPLSKKKTIIIKAKEKLSLKQRLHRTRGNMNRPQSVLSQDQGLLNPLQQHRRQQEETKCTHEQLCILSSFQHQQSAQKQLLSELELKKLDERGVHGLPEHTKQTWCQYISSFFFAELHADALTRNSITVGKDGRTSMQDVISTRHAAEREFHNIYLFSKPILFFRAVELCIMSNCLYLAIWLTNMITITEEADLAEDYDIFIQLAMLAPVMYSFYVIAQIAETCSLLGAVSDLNIEVTHEVIVQMQESETVADELREKLLNIARSERIPIDSTQEQCDFVDQLFDEIDLDGSGTLECDEFRELLRFLHLTYSDRKYRLLFYALDNNGDGFIVKEEFKQFLFPATTVGATEAEVETETESA